MFRWGRSFCNLCGSVVVVDCAIVDMNLAVCLAGNSGGDLDLTKWVHPAGITEWEGVVAGQPRRASLDITNSLRTNWARTHYRTLPFASGEANPFAAGPV